MLINPTCLTQVFSDLLLVSKEMKFLPLENLQVLTNLLDSYPTLTISFLYLSSTGISYSIPIFGLNTELIYYLAITYMLQSTYRCMLILI